MEGRKATVYGWNFVQFNGSSYDIGKTQPYGITFAEYPIVITSAVGFLNGSDPKDQSIVDTSDGKMYTSNNDITKTSFTADIIYTSNVLSTSYRAVYTWRAEGII